MLSKGDKTDRDFTLSDYIGVKMICIVNWTNGVLLSDKLNKLFNRMLYRNNYMVTFSKVIINKRETISSSFFINVGIPQ